MSNEGDEEKYDEGWPQTRPGEVDSGGPVVCATDYESSEGDEPIKVTRTGKLGLVLLVCLIALIIYLKIIKGW